MTQEQDDQSPNASEWMFYSEQPLIGPSVENTFALGLQVYNPEPGTYRFEVHGIGTGPYTFNVGRLNGDVNTVDRTITGNTTPGQVREFEVAYARAVPPAILEVSISPEPVAGDDQNAGLNQLVTFDGSRSFDADVRSRPGNGISETDHARRVRRSRMPTKPQVILSSPSPFGTTPVRVPSEP